MPLIDDIIAKIDALPITDGALALNASDFAGLDYMATFFSNLLRTQSLTLAGANRTTDGQAITVTGQASLLGYSTADLTVDFRLQDNQVIGTVTVAFAANKTTALPVLTWIKVGDIALTVALGETFSIVSFGYKMSVITPDGTRIPVSLEQMSDGAWRLAIADGASQSVPVSELVSLLDGQASSSFLPQKLADALDAVEIGGIETIYDPAAKTISFFTVSVTFAKGWDIAPKVSLEPGLEINLTLSYNADATREFIANVKGTLMLDSVAVPLQVGTSVGGTTLWTFGIRIGQKVTLPKLSALTDLAGVSDVLPAKLSDVPAIEIDTLAVTFDSTQNLLTELDFSVATASSWPVIAGYFEIEQLSVALQLSNVTDSATREVYGTLCGLFLIGETEVFCSLAKTFDNPDWTITAGLPPDATLDITSLFKQLLESAGIPLPDNLPTINFTTLLVTVVPGKQTFALSAGSTDTWSLISGKLDIEGFQLEFDRDATRKPAISGTISSSLKILAVTVDLSASLNTAAGAGWTFKGNTKEGDTIPIGDFLAYIAGKFGVSSPPAWLGSLTLNSVAVEVNTSTKDFSFTLGAAATISGQPCTFSIQFALTHQDGGYQLAPTGTFKVGAQTFTLDFTKTGTNTQLGATWTSGQGSALSLQDIARIFGNADLVALLAEIPSDMELALTSLSFTYDFTHSELVLTAVSENYGALLFVAVKPGQDWVFVFLVAVGKFDLTRLPLIGDEVGKLGPFEVDDFNLLVCSGTLASDEIGRIKTLIESAEKATGATLPTLPDSASGLQKGVNLRMTFQVAGHSVPVAVGTASKSQSIQLHSAVALTPSASQDAGNNVPAQNGYWINLQKAFGPVYMDKIGFAYADSALDISFNFTLTLGAMSLTLDGLSAGSKLKEFKPFFSLQGLGLTFKSSSVEISGGFVRQEVAGQDEYNGQALIKAGTFSVSALGSYTKVDGATSMFVFASLQASLGGPPYFFVTGLAAGFGYNRSLVLPGLDQIASFPLVSGFVPGQSSPFSGGDPNQALQVLVSENVVPVAIGENWLAAGVQFTSFEMLQSFALVAVEFGTSLEIELLGLSTASIPTGDPRPLLYAQLAIDVRILPDDGLVSVEAKLTSNSYLLDPDCHLTGGFAFYIWFGNNAHAGDFVVTLGGYHPHFNKPGYYPDVPPLGFNWIVTSELTIKGEMYFALTPICLMAGGSLEALWESGSLRCWFDLGADFLIMWKPYHYEIDLYLSFGVSYTFEIDLLFTSIDVTISVSLGADLSIWGPAFSGVAHIHLWIVSFSVDFGASASQTPPPISWPDFEESFLPAASNSEGQQRRFSLLLAGRAGAAGTPPTTSYQVWNLAPIAGLVRTLDPKVDDDLDWIVDPSGTVFQLKTLIPAKQCTIANLIVQGTDKNGNPVPVNADQVVITNPDALKNINVVFGIGPADVAAEDFTSAFTLTLTYADGLISDEQVFYFTALIQSAPKALWLQGEPDIGSNSTLVPDVLLGFELTSREAPPDNTPWADVSLLGFVDDSYRPTLEWSAPALVAGPPQPAEPFADLETTIVAAPERSAIISALIAGGTDVDDRIDVSRMAKKAADVLLAPPIFAYEYAKQGKRLTGVPRGLY